MIDFHKFVLQNGLRVIVHEDKSSPLVAFNILYGVGSKDEDPEHTGFAHLFEHLMFGGSKNIKDFDGPIQMAGGENNAFTNSDITNYYNTVPAENIETIFWLESDRMNQLDFSQESLDVQKKVVVEEFKETCLNKPYGDVWHHLSGLAYKDHSYQWPTIGKVPAHIENAKLERVKEFFYNYYSPSNAVLVLSGNISLTRAQDLSDKWFGVIPKREVKRRPIAKEQVQSQLRIKEVRNNVPNEAVYMGFHIPERLHPDYPACDILSDVFANGRSSRFYQNLCKDPQVFSAVDAYVTGSMDPGLFIIEGKPMPDFSLDASIDYLWKEIEKIQKQGMPERELQKLKNKMESSLIYSEVSILTKAMNLAYYEHLGDVDLINRQSELYNALQTEDIVRIAKKYLIPENCSMLRYFPN